ncbi:MAG: outer membrane protein assembly factor BamD [Campylobacteraceae bacterium]|jgi:outer membrane protein assembly factor BamD|nr:outer membrane protein assembly factor BamD [Campylobacteraceae bacterium]
MNIKTVVLAFVCILAVSGCADKNADMKYNQSAEYWYNEIIKTIIIGDLEKADAYYVSLSSEHVASPILSEALIILAQAHMDSEEYAEANKFLDEYIKRFGSSIKNEYIKYMKIRANYASFLRPNRNQQLIAETIADTKKFLDTYPDSQYSPMIESMLVHMELGEYLIDKNIASLYEKLNKGDAAEFYNDKSGMVYLKEGEIIEPTIPWYRRWFEW